MGPLNLDAFFHERHRIAFPKKQVGAPSDQSFNYEKSLWTTLVEVKEFDIYLHNKGTVLVAIFIEGI